MTPEQKEALKYSKPLLFFHFSLHFYGLAIKTLDGEAEGIRRLWWESNLRPADNRPNA